MAGLLYLLARILFRAADVALLVGMLVAGRRDVLRPDADRHERRLRRVLHRRRVHVVRADLDWALAQPLGVLGRLPVVGVLLGLALASKWVALYAIGGIGS